MQKGGIRHGRGAYRALVLALVASALVGCSGGESGSSAPGAPPRLVVSDFDGELLLRTTTLDCAVRGGSCDRVVALLPRLAPSGEEICTQIYGGPERRVVTGTLEGRAVRIAITRVDGCQIERYDLLTEALDE